MVSPIMTVAENRAHATFMALLWALSNPGRVELLPPDLADGMVAVGEVLIDLETSFFSSDEALVARLARTGARRATSDVARYQFFPSLGADDLTYVAAATTGSYLYPDDGATIVVGCDSLRDPARAGRNGATSADRGQTSLLLTGPGVNGSAQLQIGGVPLDLWAIRERAIRYPLGWDLFLIAGRRLVGIPRTTVVEVRA